MPTTIQVKAPAKLNLFLQLTGLRADGYHLIHSYVLFLSLCDTLHITYPGHNLLTSKLTITKENTVLRAAQALGLHADFLLEKSIPLGAGLGGGAADAAACLRGLLSFMPHSEKKPSKKKILDICLSIGADVPICYYKTPCLVQGIGELLTPLPPPTTELGFLIIYPNFPLSTQEVFQKNNQPFQPPPLPIPQHFTSLKHFLTYLNAHTNSLTPTAIALYPPIKHILKALEMTSSCLLAQMTGSGSACFGLFPTLSHAQQALKPLKKTFSDCQLIACSVLKT